MSITSNIDKVAADLTKHISKEVKETIVPKGLDKALEKSKKNLSKKLFNIVSEIKDNGQVTTRDIQEGVIDLPKGEEEIVKHLTGVDIQKFNKTKDYTTITDSKIAFAHQNAGKGPAKRVRLRLPMNTGDTYQSQLNQAKQFFNETIFAIPDEAGDMKYFVNPGIDLSKHIKVVCSTKGGDDKTNESSDRFNRAISNNDYAEWSVFQNTIDEVIKKDFINITSTIDDIKKGESDEAFGKLSREKQTDRIKELKEKVAKISSNQELQPGMEAYNNLVGLIRTLKITKRITKTGVVYSLEANFNEPSAIGDTAESLERKFFDRMKATIGMWKINNADYWINALVKEILKSIKNFKQER